MGQFLQQERLTQPLPRHLHAHFASVLPQAPPSAHGFPQLTPADDLSFKREKSVLPKLQVKGGDSTSVTRIINEWLQKTALSLNTWSASGVQPWHHAVATARAAHQQ